MAAGGHFGWPKITFDHITPHFRTILFFFFFFFFSKWRPAAILEVRFGPFWMIENHFRSHFSPFQINTQLFCCWNFGSPICAKNNRVLPLCVINGYAKYEVDRWIYDTVRDATSFLSIFIQNGHQRPFCFSKNHKVLVIWDLHGYDEYELDWCICDKVMACTCVGVRRRQRRRRRHQNIIPRKLSNFGDIIIMHMSRSWH